MAHGDVIRLPRVLTDLTGTLYLQQPQAHPLMFVSLELDESENGKTHILFLLLELFVPCFDA